MVAVQGCPIIGGNRYGSCTGVPNYRRKEICRAVKGLVGVSCSNWPPPQSLINVFMLLE